MQEKPSFRSTTNWAPGGIQIDTTATGFHGTMPNATATYIYMMVFEESGIAAIARPLHDNTVESRLSTIALVFSEA